MHLIEDILGCCCALYPLILYIIQVTHQQALVLQQCHRDMKEGTTP